VRTAFGELSPSTEVRRLMATTVGWEPAGWARLAGELDLPGLLLPTEHGGAGFSCAELGVVLEEAGATLLCAPLFSTAALAVPLLLACADDAALSRYGGPISSGRLTATVALAEDGGRWTTEELRTVARRDGPGWVVDGAKNYVVDGGSAGLILVVAATEVGPAVFAVDADATGLRREPLVTLDQTRKQARLTFEHTPATQVGPADATAVINHASDVSRALLAAEQTGGAQRCLDLTVAYAKARIQFGRPIGGFQAVKQRIADLLIQVESARSAAYAAVQAAAGNGATGNGMADNGDELARIARIAAITCADAYAQTTAQTIQLHGGIGFTWEHDAHLYLKRARASGQLLGTPHDHITALARYLDADAG
jgi:acyl-CoA dehydrogenase